jgi:hypothetical protein
MLMRDAGCLEHSTMDPFTIQLLIVLLVMVGLVVALIGCFGSFREFADARTLIRFFVPLAIFLGWIFSARRRPARKGYCTVCGYDLRASPERCPECGTSIPPKTEN